MILLFARQNNLYSSLETREEALHSVQQNLEAVLDVLRQPLVQAVIRTQYDQDFPSGFVFFAELFWRFSQHIGQMLRWNGSTTRGRADGFSNLRQEIFDAIDRAIATESFWKTKCDNAVSAALEAQKRVEEEEACRCF